jgi:hypothetical protein
MSPRLEGFLTHRVKNSLLDKKIEINDELNPSIFKKNDLARNLGTFLAWPCRYLVGVM